MTAMSSPQQPQGQEAPQGYGPPPGHVQPQPYAPQGQQYAQQPYAPQPYAPQPQPYAPQPQPQPFGGGPTGELVVNLRKPFGGAGWVSPVLAIDGYPAAAAWGRNVFPAPVGVRRVDVASSYLWTFGRASMPVTVEAGRSVEVHYTGPMWTFGMPGRMGPEPQKRAGMGLFIGLTSFVGAVLLLAILVGIFSGP